MRAAIPVVSVGNLTVGGTGKTPVVEFLARWYRSRGLRVAILSRGYGAKDGPNDEALLLEENLPDVPHLQGSDRAALARIAVEELDSELLVLDDGFQHRRLQRDLDVVLIDATDPWGGGWVLPAGLLREPASSLARAGLILITRCDAIDEEALVAIEREIGRCAPRILVARTRFAVSHLTQEGGETSAVDSWVGRRVLAFCGIGNPEAFEQTLVGLGIEVVDRRDYPDHHAYSAEDVASLSQWAGSMDVSAVVTTQKDAVKLRLADLGGRPLWVVRLKLVIETQAEPMEEILGGVPTRVGRVRRAGADEG
jgi:tetraacyldisaccharide 4'-kinase